MLSWERTITAKYLLPYESPFVNHACQPNAAPIYDETARVAIFFAQRDIQPGEEITICYYTPFFWLVPIESSTGETLEEEMKIAKDIMAEDYGITCPTAIAPVTTQSSGHSSKKQGRSLRPSSI